MDKKTKTLTYLISLSFFVYFLLLIAERLISVSLSLANGVNLYADGFSGYVYTVVFVSIGAFLVYLLIRCRKNIKALFKMEEEPPFRDLIIAAGILLLSGMVHTEYTISGLQFASYGIWIAGILLKVILLAPNSVDKVLLWLSFAFLVSFSMAIPVMYRTYLDTAKFFHLIEGIGGILLVGLFTYAVGSLFGGCHDLFHPSLLLTALVIDVPLIVMRWSEEPNIFVLIFASLTLALFIAGIAYKDIQRRKQKRQEQE